MGTNDIDALDNRTEGFRMRLSATIKVTFLWLVLFCISGTAAAQDISPWSNDGWDDAVNANEPAAPAEEPPPPAAEEPPPAEPEAEPAAEEQPQEQPEQEPVAQEQEQGPQFGEQAAPAPVPAEEETPLGPPVNVDGLPADQVAVIYLTVSDIKGELKNEDVEFVIRKETLKHGEQLVDDDAVKLVESVDEDGKKCISIKCSAELGKRAGATMVITGSVLRTSDSKPARINLNLVETQNGDTLAQGKKKPEDTTPEAFNAALASLVQELWSVAKPPPPPEEKNEDEVKEDEKEKIKEDRFFKGALTTIGPLEIIVPNNRAGVVMGYRKLFFEHYAYISPEVDLRFIPADVGDDYKLRMGFGVPLNVEIYSGRDRGDADKELDHFDNAGRVRKEDWDSARDYMKIIRYIQYGRKEDNLYVNVNRTFATTIGHGVVMKRYIANLDYFTTKVGAELDWLQRLRRIRVLHQRPDPLADVRRSGFHQAAFHRYGSLDGTVGVVRCSLHDRPRCSVAYQQLSSVG